MFTIAMVILLIGVLIGYSTCSNTKDYYAHDTHKNTPYPTACTDVCICNGMGGERCINQCSASNSYNNGDTEYQTFRKVTNRLGETSWKNHYIDKMSGM
jgi:hypothetical protein